MQNFLKSFLNMVIKLAVSGAIFWILIKKTPPGFWNTILHINPWWISAAMLLYGLHIFANAWRWWLLLKAQKIECSLWTACSLTMQSFFFSLVLPGAIGGDLVRIGFLTARIQKGRKFDGAFTILIDRFTGMIGIFSVAICMLPFVWKSISSIGGIIEKFIYILLIGSICGIAASVVVFNHRMLEKIKLYRVLEEFGNKITHGMYSKVTIALDSYSNCRKEIIICIVSSIIFVNLVLGCVAWCISCGITGQIQTFGPVLAAITVGNIAGLLPTTPSGVGVRDAFIIPILQGGGIQYEQALAISLTITAIIILFNLSGGLFFILSPSHKKEKNND